MNLWGIPLNGAAHILPIFRRSYHESFEGLSDSAAPGNFSGRGESSDVKRTIFVVDEGGSKETMESSTFGSQFFRATKVDSWRCHTFSS